MADDFPLLRAFIEVDAKKAKREIASLRTAVKALKRELQTLPRSVDIQGSIAKGFKAASANVGALNRGLASVKRESRAVAAEIQKVARAARQIPPNRGILVQPFTRFDPGAAARAQSFFQQPLLLTDQRRRPSDPTRGRVVRPLSDFENFAAQSLAQSVLHTQAGIDRRAREILRRRQPQLLLTDQRIRGPGRLVTGSVPFDPFAARRADAFLGARRQPQLLLTDQRGIRRLADAIANVRIPPSTGRFPTFTRFGRAAARGVGGFFGGAGGAAAGAAGRGGRQNFRGITLPAIFGTFAVASFTRDSLKLATAIEKTTFALGKLTDSEPELQSLFQSLRKLAFETTTDFTELLPAAQKLLGSGFGVGEVEPLLRQLADLSIITSANGVSFDRLVNVVARNNLQFRLLTRDVREFTNAGLNILPSLQRQLGAADFEEVFDAIRKGEVNINNLKQAIADLTSEGGVAFRLQADAANTAFLAFDKLKEEVNKTKQAFGDFIIEDLGIKTAAEAAVDALRELRGEVRLTAQGIPETAGQAILRRQAQGQGGGGLTLLGLLRSGGNFGQLAILRAREKQLEVLLSLLERGIDPSTFAGGRFLGGLSDRFNNRFLGVAGLAFAPGVAGRDADFNAIRQQRQRQAADLRRRAGFEDDPVARQNLLDQAQAFEDDSRIIAEKIEAGLAELRAAIDVQDPVGAKKRERERKAEKRAEESNLRNDIELLERRAQRFRRQASAAALRGDDVAVQALDFAFGDTTDEIARLKAALSELTGVIDQIPAVVTARQRREAAIEPGFTRGRGFRAQSFVRTVNPITGEISFHDFTDQTTPAGLTERGQLLGSFASRNIPEFLNIGLEALRASASRAGQAGPFLGLFEDILRGGPKTTKFAGDFLTSAFGVDKDGAPVATLDNFREGVQNATEGVRAFQAAVAKAPGVIIKPFESLFGAEARAELNERRSENIAAQLRSFANFESTTKLFGEAVGALKVAAIKLENANVAKFEGPEQGVQ